MAQAELTIDLGALRANWQALRNKARAETGAVVKADAYGLGVDKVAPALAGAGARKFFVAMAEEGARLRGILGPGPGIYVFSGHMPGDTDMIRDAQLTPMLNDIDQVLRHVEALPGHGFGVQLDTGMNRLGMEPAEWAALREIVVGQSPRLIMSHLACADEPDHPMNAHQLRVFSELTQGISAPRSLSATGGILLGQDYHFEVTRPGIGMYGAQPFGDAQPVVSLQIPVIQVREVEPGESVGYGNTWVARQPARIATIAGGYADGLLRGMGGDAFVWVGNTRCKIVGRISMDMIGIDISGVEGRPESVEMLGAHQSVDTLADWGKTIGYEILTSLGNRYRRTYVG